MSSGWQEARIDVEGLEVRYLRTGGAGPAVVLAHGVTDGAGCWTRVARELEADFDVVMPDARGHGGSGRPGHGYDYPTLAEDLLGFVEAVALERPVVVGHSMGGGTAATAAAATPEQPFRALVLEDPPLAARGGWSDGRRRRYADLRRRELAARQASDLPELIERARTEIHPSWHDEDLGPWARAKLEVSPEVLALFTAPAPDPRELLPRIDVPVLLLAGEPRLGSAMTEETIEACGGLLRNGRVLRVPDVGHLIHWEAFDIFVHYLREFLTERA